MEFLYLDVHIVTLSPNPWMSKKNFNHVLKDNYIVDLSQLNCYKDIIYTYFCNNLFIQRDVIDFVPQGVGKLQKSVTFSP